MDVTLTKDNNITTGKIYSVRVTARLTNKAEGRRQGADSCGNRLQGVQQLWEAPFV
jgi:hypothetical protein